MKHISEIERFKDVKLMVGKPVPNEELQGLFPAPEGELHLIYGRPRNGKTTEAVRRMYEDLNWGVPVYSDIQLNLSNVDFDDRLIPERSLRNFLFSKKRYFVFDKKNFHFFQLSTGKCDGKQVFNPGDVEDCVRWLNTLTDCSIYIDEGHKIIFSYEGTKQSIPKMTLTTESGHFNRRIILITQRTQSVHVNARGNIHVFFRCSKVRFFFWTYLKVEEFTDMKGSDVDETEVISIARHFFNKRAWMLYDTHALRNGRPRSQEVMFEAYDLNFIDRLISLYFAFGGVPLKRPPQVKVTRINKKYDFSQIKPIKGKQ